MSKICLALAKNEEIGDINVMLNKRKIIYYVEESNTLLLISANGLETLAPWNLRHPESLD